MKKSEQVITFLGKEVDFEGTLKFNGTTRIDGHFKGEILAGGHLIVREEAKIEATIHASHIVIHGEIHGNITADDRVEIHSPAKVFGNIHAPTIVMDEGVVFEGMTRMHQTKKKADEVTAISGSDTHAKTPPAPLTTIFGTVTDHVTGKPVKNAKVKCRGPEKRTTETSGAGYYELTDLKEGTWELKITADGYKKEKTQIQIYGEAKYEHNFDLTAKK
jgi:cytoskeletal protein CcmA (bactofilin family)